MAVYTHIGAEEMAALLAEYDVGGLVSAKGIAEGVENSNWLVDTAGRDGAGARFILTVYEKRVKPADLPFFLGLLDHLAAAGCPVPRTIHDRQGAAFRMLGIGPDAKALALIEFLPGVSLDQPTPAQARSVGAALAGMHIAARSFAGERANTLGPIGWPPLAAACAGHWDEIDPGNAFGLGRLVEREVAAAETDWPANLPSSVIHADLFPDNVLMVDDRVSGLIDFYFACTDAMAYDLAVTHAAWCFDKAGEHFSPAVSQALLAGYEAVRPIEPAERAAMTRLARGAALRFVLTRAFDWVNTPPGAMVTRKDPLAFARRLEFYADPANADLFA
ncbi:homoserine kinase [Novosphingobium tardum]|uniref:Homoserine kinase n=1 Tax=Novosphingobium tardum TaxID=1538021 RepID=A0ABV8RMF5_9SPHN